MKNIEKMMKFCSKINNIFGYPYFFNWSAPNNHGDNTPEGEIQDVSYVIFRAGIYPGPTPEIIDGVEYIHSSGVPIEKQLIFGQVSRILDFTIFNNLLTDGNEMRSDYTIKSFDDLEQNKEVLKEKLSKYLL